ncbi:TetR/AcrR family transcriptional regulator [Tropicimonas aquimaris]|uniref:TetR/AcrR family transcriptional regulator n=1 Tax=Tropicimonas aquimaris TaxID=914152 RepID=A0ABW3IKB5_9RHOB
MSAKTDARRDALRTCLVDIAERQISEAGLGALKARRLATEAGCSVGAIYNVFSDLNELTMAVNGRTFRRLGAAIEADLADVPGASPQERLVVMSIAYLRFASENEHLWRCLFDLRVTELDAVPAWYLAALEDLFAVIGGPLREIFPDLSATDIALMTRALFSSVHGIVSLGLEQRISGVPRPQIERMIELILSNLTAQSAAV